MNKLMAEIHIENRGVYHNKSDTLVISDLHIGSRVESNHAYPQPNFSEVQLRVENLLHRFNPSRIILNGDVFAYFPPDEEALSILEKISQKCSEKTFIYGNHEEKIGVLPEEISKEWEIEKQGKKIDDVYVTHGHKTPPERANLYIIGHLHPMINGKSCFAYHKSSFHGNSVLILPPFTSAVGGVDIRKQSIGSHCPIIDDGLELSQYSYHYADCSRPMKF